MGIYGSICSNRLARGSDREQETEKETWPEREREEETGGWRETQTDRKTEWLIRICLFSLVRRGLRG